MSDLSAKQTVRQATIDTTTAKALSATITPSVATGSITCHHALLESLS